MSLEDCLEAPEHAFGTAESVEELYFAFRLLQQQPGEKLSDFLRCLEQSLNRVVERDGLPLGCADKARLDQLLCGAIASDLMLVNLRLRERRAKPPTFLQLLKEICTEEECEASRQKITPALQGGNIRQNANVKQTEIQNLKSEIEIKELKALIAAVVSKPAHNTAVSSEKIPPNEVYGECSSDSFEKTNEALAAESNK